MDRIELDGHGSVVSFTTLQMPPEGFTPPLTMALVELEHGALILCLAKDQSDSVKIGDQVDLTMDSENRFLYLTTS
jgi:uncharacterized OB-fold protein